MRKHRSFGRVLPCLLAILLLVSACSDPSVYGERSSAGETLSSAQTSSEEAGASSTQEDAGVLPQDTLARQLSEAFATPVKMDPTISGSKEMVLGRNVGGMMKVPEAAEAEVIDEEQKAEITRAMRAYSNQTTVQIINNAESYYVYDKLNKEEKNMYDAFYVLAQDPTTSDNYVSFQTGMDIQGEDFWEELFVAQISVVYDHPELWWLYPFSGCTEISYYLGSEIGGNNGKTLIYANFTKTYNTFESDVKAFNQAVNSILSKINLNADEEEIAQAIHDRLIELCTYDYDVLEQNLSDKAHTAFGAIVRNSRGTANYCVCDGYAQAYLYLLQQAGIEGVVVIGMAGDAGSDGGAGAHAWSMVNLNGIWYEVDACWDDYTGFEDDIANYYEPGSAGYQYEMELASDKDYMFRVYHCMYGLSTAEIENFQVSDDLVYTTRDGRYQFSIVGDSQRWRMDKDDDPANRGYGWYDRCLPTATSTLNRNTLRSDGRTGSGNGGGNSSENTGSGNTSENTGSGNTQSEVEVRGPLYQLIAGTYYVSAFNNYDEAFLKKYYGDEYYKQLSMFELRTDASGTLYENGTSAEFYYVFDGYSLCMYSATMGLTFLYYDNGRLLMYDFYGNIYTFSKMK